MSPQQEPPLLDLHATATGYALSLVWRDADGEELKSRFVMGFSTLTAAARARGKLMGAA